jgi:ATP-dependent DNA helicase RecQ
MEPLEATLAQHFGFTRFRPGQRAVIEAVLGGRPVLAVMPTGAGKSLCFQLPALRLRGLTLVVSPLVALMREQVQRLNAQGVAAAALDASQSTGMRAQALRMARRGQLRLLYVSPERLRGSDFVEALQGTLALLAIDEAHCISQWGHDFRPDYARLGAVRAQLGPARTVALTATASPEVQADIVTTLGMPEAVRFVAGFDRPNLHLGASEGPALAAAAALAVRGPGIVYAATRRRAETLGAALRARGLAAEVYHAGLPGPVREGVQDRFGRGSLDLVVATNAFGMGIDRADVRFVLHAQLPRSIEAYYQEVGRAGRDGAPAVARLCVQPGDYALQARLLEASYPPRTLVEAVWGRVRFRPLVGEGVEGIAGALGAQAPQVLAALKLLERAGHLEPNVRLEGDAEVETLLPPPPESPLGGVWGQLGGGAPTRVSLDALGEESGLSGPVLRQWLGRHAREGQLAVRLLGARRVWRVVDLGKPASALRVDFEAVVKREAWARDKLDQMAAYARTTTCRRAVVLRYFGEAAPVRCQACDRCAPVLAPVVARAPVRRETGFRVTQALVASGLGVEEVARLRGLTKEEAEAHLLEGEEVGVR